ncbi:mannonate dehydratase [Pleomorphomonas diazotrophica]|uniref:Mannonate dehydratase n=1 Tax=Pleomorphomonas diazotrophica TaxID=1166257 RepID=A0A1I4UV91_9HYPH|nr:mannonate dehydratase [Pleomorphomonas diazotrophica]PKR89793.1 mannonate dehydratase [Pleomorphomonas diazotrophica]SFM92818.1 D-mannonate dehydratase [Pleomorphomonas diazotrophica]
MQETWRWFGPDDPVSLEKARQAGATGIVTALHHMNQGQVWTVDEVEKRKAEVEAAGLVWSVVESIGVGEEIKTRTGNYREKIDNYKQSIRNVARSGVKTICYNFMVITDWSRTNLMFKLPNGGYALRYDRVDFAAYDLFVLKRRGAEADYGEAEIAAARARLAAKSEAEVAELERNLIDWLPARDFAYTRDSFRDMLQLYSEIGIEDLRANLVEFLKEITPVAEEEGARLCIHADDPAFPIFGLPRVMSTADDVRKMFQAVPEEACGLTLCTGSFGSNTKNDLVAMAKEFGPRIHFVHLRNVTHEADGSFYEADHLGGDTDLIGVAAAILTEEERRRSIGRADTEIPFRPDHGHLMGDDIGQKSNPGYSFVGRLKGLAELRGAIKTIEAFRSGRVS